MLKLLALFAFTSLASGIGQPGNYEDRSADWQAVYKEEGFDKPAKCTVKVKTTIKLKKGETFDGKGCRYVWIGKNAKDCHAEKEISENQPRMFEMAAGSTIKNLQAECMLEAIKMADNTRVTNITVLDVEEDAVSTSGKGNIIENSKFYLANDKTIQMNQSSGVVIRNNFFKHAGRAISGSGSTKGGADDVRFDNNRCENCELMIRAQSDHKVYAKGNTLDGGEAMFETVDKSVVYDCGGNKVSGGADMMSKDGTKNVKACPAQGTKSK